MDDEEEETLLEYATFHELASEPSVEFDFGVQLDPLTATLNESTLDDAPLPQISSKRAVIEDRPLTVCRDAARLLHDVKFSRIDANEYKKLTSELCSRPRPKKLKLGLPLLKTDPEVDWRQFRKDVSEQYVYEDSHLPPDPTDKEKDEGVQWPTAMLELPQKIMAECENVKLAPKHPQEKGKSARLLTEHERPPLTYLEKNLLDPITPPLSPLMMPVIEPFVPSSSDMLLPLTSDPPSTIAADLETAEKKIFAKESLLSARVEGKDGGYDTDMEGASTHFPELESLPSSELFPPIQRFKKDDLKIDPPLTPPTHLPSLPKTVTFSEHVEEMLLDMDYSGELSRAVSRNDEEQEKATGKEIERQLFLDEELLAILEQEAAKAEQKINNEQLQDAATTKKYQVPTLDFTLPQLPWKTGLKSSRDVVKCQRDTILKAVDGANLPTDEHGLRSLERKLRWMPFPSNLGRVALDEQLGTDRDLTQFMYNDERESISVDALASRRPKLKCLESDDEDEDDELGPATFPAPEKLEDIFSLLRKRKLDSDLSNRSGTNGDNEESGGPGMMGHLFSATNALDNFMEVRGKKKPKLTDSGYFVAPQAVMAVPAGPTPPIIPKPNTPAKILKSQPQPIQLPSTNPPPGETTFIISVELMKLRPIIRQIGTLYPSAKLIERDFSRHNKSAWNRGSVARSPVISSLDAEADIIFSPSTGAIVTSFAKVKQKPLPGQKSQVAIRARIEAACKRYESLLVLISEGNSDESSRGLNGQDCIALTDFIGYCGSLPTSTTAVFVPGGKQSLATWITATMIQHGVHGGSVNCLIEVETVWELFLRRCGMNAYAAQTVMGALKAPEGVNTDSPSKAGLFGLPGFVRMDHRERCRRFEAMLGGTAVLKRVSAMIDTSWRPYTPLMGPNKDLMPHFQDASSGMY